MLYPRWLETVRLHGPRPAIWNGREVVTFSELAAAVAVTPIAEAPVIARSGGMEFFIEILRAWRDDQAVIPVERDAPEPQLKQAPPAGTKLVKYTPGACGVPRGIFMNDAQLEADGDRITVSMGLVANVPNLAVISLAHSYGFSNIFLPMVLHGVPMHLVPVPFPQTIMDAFRAHSAVVLPAVPSMWRAWHRAGILKNAPIRLAVSAGSPLSTILEREVHAAAGLKIHNFYGASECGGISFDSTDLPREHTTDVGHPLPGVTVEVQPDGRLRVTSTSVASGYDESRLDDELGEGSYLTRDTGFFHETGTLHFTGTLGGAINVSGRKVSPAKVVAALESTGLARRIRVFGQPSADVERFEEIAAELEILPGHSLDGLKHATADLLQTWELPRHWRLLSAAD